MLKRTPESAYDLAGPDDTDWAARSEYWRNYRPFTRGAPKKFKYREPLILCGHGIRLRVDHGTLFIRNGFTHYPQKAEEIRFFPGDPNLPDRIIILDGNGGISFDALNWMSDQKIILVQLNWRGELSFVSGNSGYSANPKLVENQLAIKGTTNATEIARQLIQEKIFASAKTLIEVFPKTEKREIAISRLGQWHTRIIKLRKGVSLSNIMGIEGGAAAAYFQVWHGLKLNWGSGRGPIPGSWRVIGARSMTWRRHAQNARHPVNAMLNYGYAIMKSQVRAQVVAAGLDPSIGILHGNRHNKMPLVSDLMEPLRPIVDRNVLAFALSHKFMSGDFAINRLGGCRLNPQIAKVVSSLITGISDKTITSEYLKRIQRHT